MTERPSPPLPTTGPHSRASKRSISSRNHALRVIVAFLLMSVLAITGCGIGSSGGDGDEDSPADNSGEVDFRMTGLAATPNQLLSTDVIVIDATIRNTGDSDSGDFEVRSFLRTGPDCDGASYFLESRTLSLDADSSTAFQVSTIPGNTVDFGIYYLCVEIDATNQIDELDESNNLIGGAAYPVTLAECLTDAACDDANPCTDDLCRFEFGCRSTINTEPCDDGLFCTVNDTCSGGSCQSGDPRECSDSDLCDGTAYCDELEGECRNGPLPVACDDGNVCNGLETCNPIDAACLPGTPISCDVLVNNGLAPPTTSNVIDHRFYDSESSQRVLLRDLGCPTFGEPDSECATPGTPTILEVTLGSDVGELQVFDNSVLQVTGGSIEKLMTGQDAVVLVSGGIVDSFESDGSATVSGGRHGLLQMYGESSVSGGVVESLELDSGFASPGGELRGGIVTTLYSGTESAVRGGRVSLLCARGEAGVIYGTGFDQNDGRFGPVFGATGFLSGTLEMGDPLNATYHQTGSWCFHPIDGTFDTAGSFTLLPPPSAFVANGQPSGGPQNTLDASDVATRYHDIVVRNSNCPDAWPAARRDDPCSDPGFPTEVEVVDGAVIPGLITVLDQAAVVIRGGQIGSLRTGAAAIIEIWGDNFTVAGVQVAFGEVAAANGVLEGTLLSGEPFVANFDREDPSVPSNFGTIILRSAAELGEGT